MALFVAEYLLQLFAAVNLVEPDVRLVVVHGELHVKADVVVIGFVDDLVGIVDVAIGIGNIAVILRRIAPEIGSGQPMVGLRPGKTRSGCQQKYQ